MKPIRTRTVEEYKLTSSFERVRTTLLDEQYADRLERPLAYWALPNDRRSWGTRCGVCWIRPSTSFVRLPELVIRRSVRW